MKFNISFSLVAAFILYACNNAELQSEKKEAEITQDTQQAAPTPVTAPAPAPYMEQLEYGKVHFTITSPQSSTANTFTVAPSGFSNSNDTLVMECEGLVVRTEVADIDADQGPELLVVTQSGADQKAKAYVFSGNKTKSLSMVNLPEIIDPAKTKGYSGHDDFALVESSFSHRFPLYENGKAINKTRQFQYKLKPGEAMKQLVLDKTIEY